MTRARIARSALGALVALAGASTASGALEVRTQIDSVEVFAGGAADVNTLCASGESLGGGFDTSQVLDLSMNDGAPTFGPDSLDALNFQVDDGRIPTPVGWSSSARSRSSSNETLRIAAICADTSLTVTSATETATPGGEASPTALCEADEVATGGGVVTTNLSLTIPSASSPVFGATGTRLFDQPLGAGPAPTGWEASARNEGDMSDPSQDVTVGAICSAELSVSTVVAMDTASSGTFGVERVLCPAGSVAVGGGVDPSSSAESEITSSAPVFEEGTDVERLIQRFDGLDAAPVGWQASVLNEGGSPLDFKVGVVCLPEPGAAAQAAVGLAALLALRARRSRR